MQQHVEKDSLIRAVEWMLDNGAQLTPGDMGWPVLMNGTTMHCEALAQVLRERNQKHFIEYGRESSVIQDPDARLRP